jgi:hypothetical protein
MNKYFHMNYNVLKLNVPSLNTKNDFLISNIISHIFEQPSGYDQVYIPKL